MVLRWWGACVVAVVVAGGCSLSGGDGEETKPAARDVAQSTIRIGVPPLPKEWDPGLVSTNADFHVMDTVFAPLVRNSTGKVQGWLASDVSSRQDGRSYDITLRKDARWSDGRPVTADDVVFTWRRNASKAFGSGYAYVMESIVGFDEVNAGGPVSRLGVSATGPRSVRVKLKHPVPWFERMLALHIFTPVPAHAARRVDWAEDPTAIVHSGGYDVTSIDGLRRATLTARTGSWALHQPHARTIKLKAFSFKREATAWSAWRSGTLDVAYYIFSQGTDPEVAEAPGVRTRPDPTVGYYVVADRGVLADMRLRRLIYHTLDLPALIKASGYAKDVLPPRGLIPPMVPGADVVNSSVARPEDLPDGSAGGARIRVAYYPELSQSWRELKRQLEAVGFKVVLVPFFDDGAAVQKEIESGPKTFDIGPSNGWYWDYPDPHTFLNVFTCGGYSAFGHCDRAYDELVGRAASTMDDEQRFDLERQALARIMGENGSFTVIPRYFDLVTYACRANVVCLEDTGKRYDFYFDEMYVKR